MLCITLGLIQTFKCHVKSHQGQHHNLPSGEVYFFLKEYSSSPDPTLSAGKIARGERVQRAFERDKILARRVAKRAINLRDSQPKKFSADWIENERRCFKDMGAIFDRIVKPKVKNLVPHSLIFFCGEYLKEILQFFLKPMSVFKFFQMNELVEKTEGSMQTIALIQKAKCSSLLFIKINVNQTNFQWLIYSIFNHLLCKNMILKTSKKILISAN